MAQGSSSSNSHSRNTGLTRAQAACCVAAAPAAVLHMLMQQAQSGKAAARMELWSVAVLTCISSRTFNWVAAAVSALHQLPRALTTVATKSALHQLPKVLTTVTITTSSMSAAVCHGCVCRGSHAWAALPAVMGSSQRLLHSTAVMSYQRALHSKHMGQRCSRVQFAAVMSCQSRLLLGAHMGRRCSRSQFSCSWLVAHCKRRAWGWTSLVKNNSSSSGSRSSSRWRAHPRRPTRA